MAPFPALCSASLMRPSAGPSPAPGRGFFMSRSASGSSLGSSLSGHGSSANKPNPGRPPPAESTLPQLLSPNASLASPFNRIVRASTLPSLLTPITSQAFPFGENTVGNLLPSKRRTNSFATSLASPSLSNTTPTSPPAQCCSNPWSRVCFATVRLLPTPACPSTRFQRS